MEPWVVNPRNYNWSPSVLASTGTSGLVCDFILCFTQQQFYKLGYFRMTHVQKKAQDDICAFQADDGRIVFSKELYPQNHISSYDLIIIIFLMFFYIDFYLY